MTTDDLPTPTRFRSRRTGAVTLIWEHGMESYYMIAPARSWRRGWRVLYGEQFIETGIYRTLAHAEHAAWIAEAERRTRQSSE